MTIPLKPELQAIIQKDVQRGPYESVDEFVERAVELLHEQEEWVSENRAEIAAQVERGFAQVERGELIDGAEAVRWLRQRRAARLKQR